MDLAFSKIIDDKICIAILHYKYISLLVLFFISPVLRQIAKLVRNKT